MVGSEPAPSGVGAVLGKYKLVRLLGEGGMGSVYEATHQDLGRRVAVKTLHPRFASSQDVRQRFLREGQSAARIRHPNVADVYDVGNEGDQPYLVMEYLEGEDLGRLLEREGQLSVQRAVDLLLPVVAAVAAAHDLGVVHRDLKPDNIFLCVERGVIKPKVLDFGISKLTNEEEAKALTGTGAMLGTPYYMSPEQAQGSRHLDFRSDHYSLGVILYECVTGHRPIEEPSLYSLIRRIVAGDFAPPRQINPSLSVAFEEVVLKALAHDPKDRFATTREFGRALLPFAGESTSAHFAEDFDSGPGHAKTVSSGSPPAEPRKNTPGRSTTLGESAVHQSDVQNRPSSSQRWLVLGGAGAAAIALAGYLAFSSTPEAPSGTSTASGAAPAEAALSADAVPPEATASSAPPDIPAADGVAPALPSALRKRLLTEPLGAEVWSDGAKLGETPLSVEVSPGVPLHLEVRLSGYVTRTLEVTEADPDDVSLQLVKEARPVRPAAVARPPATDRPSLAPR